ncbi:MAG: S-layer homology domain-containing protein [Acidimicrobiia bacterium]|nr:S-layer homology domain-containing protein [Acidimicrobiia bacterium]
MSSDTGKGTVCRPPGSPRSSATPAGTARPGEHATGRRRGGRRLFAAAVVLALAAVLLATTPASALEPAPPDFDDVPDDHPFHDEIAWLAREGISTGFPDGTFRPGDDLPRQGLVALLWRMSGSPAGPSPIPASPTSPTTIRSTPPSPGRSTRRSSSGSPTARSGPLTTCAGRRSPSSSTASAA